MVPAAVRNEIAALKRRVTWLEREFARGIPERPTPVETTVDPTMAQNMGRSAAERDYWHAKRHAQLVANPTALASAIEAEREFNQFLKARGIKPLPSTLPRTVRARVPRERKPSTRGMRIGAIQFLASGPIRDGICSRHCICS